MSPPRNRPTDALPLQEPTFFILLSLVSSNKHGYAILKDVETLSNGKIRLSTGTLYEALGRLLDQGCIERLPNEEANPEKERQDTTGTDWPANRADHPGRPRKAYRLTYKGRWVLDAEMGRLQTLLAVAKMRLGDEQP